MCRTRTAALLAAFAAAVLSERAAAQIDSALLSKLSFNLTNPGGKSLAMGGAFTAIADDATAALVNPAGLGQLSSVQMGLSVKRIDESIGLVTARSTATGGLTDPWGPVTSSDSQIGFQSTNLEYAGVVVPISSRVVVAVSYAENLSFEGSADPGGYQYVEFRDNRSGGVTRRDYLYEYREFGSAAAPEPPHRPLDRLPHHRPDPDRRRNHAQPVDVRPGGRRMPGRTGSSIGLSSRPSPRRPGRSR